MNDFERYKGLSFEELIEDIGFQKWVHSPSLASSEFWDNFLKNYPEKKNIVEEAKLFLLTGKSYFEQNDKSPEEIRKSLIQVMHLAKIRIPTILKYKHRMMKKMAIAASFTLALSIGYLTYILNSNTNQKYKTDYAEWKTVQLPDASTVQLNANTSLKLSKNWKEKETRQVWLEGEAFFEVEKKLKTHSKFQVIVKDLTIEVLGTQFNVQNRGDLTEVFLKEGKIKLIMNNKEEYLNPGDFIVYSSNNKAIIRREQIPQEPYTSWRNGTMQMRSTVAEIFREIENIYGVVIEIDDKSLYNEVRKFAMPMKNLDVVIPILEISLDVQITKDKNKLIIKRNKKQIIN